MGLISDFVKSIYKLVSWIIRLIYSSIVKLFKNINKAYKIYSQTRITDKRIELNRKSHIDANNEIF